MNFLVGVGKFILYTINVVLIVFAIAMVAHCSTFLANEKSGTTKHPGFPLMIFWVVFGVFLALTIILGCCGAIFNHFVLLVVYGVTLLILCAVDIIGIILIFVIICGIRKNDTFKSEINKFLDEEYKVPGKNSEEIGHLHKIYQCCGINGTTDYTETWKVPIPESCCVNPATNCNIYFKEGCSESILNNSIFCLSVMGYIAIVLAIIFLFAGLFALYLARNNNNPSTIEKM